MKKIYALIFDVLLIAVSMSILAMGLVFARKKTLEIGHLAPDFTLKDDTGQLRTLKAMRGKKMVLYFYPMDSTPGCTKQACSIRNSFTDLTSAGIEVWGISPDSVRSHAAFKKEHNLPFPLLSDKGKKVAKIYGVKRFFGVKRVTFLIDKQGMIGAILKDIDVKHHAHQIIDAFK